ncbi:hypothetical protein MNV49_006044 [Pseudohyphozyma bogoriensis]|nr:hypothetical protein MNV49_006044 [Pseudohyphozyma bogoriensis]
MARKQQKPSGQHLAFSQPLTAKGLSNAELLKRLKALHSELASLDQDLVVPSSLDTVARECIAHSLLLHKEKGVKAYLAACLVDILRLYAPEAPYTEGELRDLFQFLIRQLKNLTTPTESHYAEYYYALDSLCNVKSIVLICDLDAGDELMIELFKQCFDSVNSEVPKNVQITICDLLTQVLEEANALHGDVVDTILSQFLPKAIKQRPSSHALAVEVCKASADKLQRYVCQYFAEVITATISGSGLGDSDDEDEDDRKGKKGEAEKLPTDFLVAHGLIKQINRSVPQLLLNVIPQLEDELTTENPLYRKLATETLGAMISEKGDLASKYGQTWKEWLKRGKDRVPAVRISWVESVPKIWREHPELGGQLEPAMEAVLEDPDDRVRTAACSVFEDLDFETASNHVTLATMKALAKRCSDKKNSVRLLAFKSLGRLYDLAFSEIENRDERATDQFGWIPGDILRTLTFSDPSIRAAATSTILQHILPLPKRDDEETQWVDRLLIVMLRLDEKEKFLLLSGLSRLSDRRPGPFETFLQICEKNNGGVIDENAEQIKMALKNTIRLLATSGRFPDATKAAEDLTKFAKANEKQLYKLIKTLSDPQSDLKTTIKSQQKDFLRRIEQISSTIVETFTYFLHAIAFLIVNRSSISPLLKRLQTRSGPEWEGFVENASYVLEFMSKHKPIMYKSHVAELTKALGDGKETQVVEIALHALSRLNKVDSLVPDKCAEVLRLVERVKHFAKSGTTKQAKYAATILALDKSKPGNAEDLVDHLADALEDASEEELVPHLAALNRFARYAPDAFEVKSEQITRSALDVINRGTVPGEVPDDEEEPWVEDANMDPLTAARVFAVKILASRCLAYAQTESASTMAEPVFQLLWPLLSQEQEKYSNPVASRLRLTASLSILKLATLEKYLPQVCSKLDVLARTTQDTCFEVRHGFLTRLLSFLRHNKLPKAVPRFNMVLFLVAHDPEEELRTDVVAYIKSCRMRLPVAARQAQWEHPFVRLIHLLAHHPDFAGDDHEPDDIDPMSKYIRMFIDNVVTEENIPYIYHLALRLKTVRDAAGPEFDTNLYILAEVAQHLLSQTSKANGWAIPTHPEQVPLPNDIFRAAVDAKKNVKTTYLAPEVLEKLSSGKATKVARLNKRPKAPPRSPKAKAAPKAKRVSKKKADKWDPDADDSSDEEVEDADSDESEAEVVNKRPRGPPKDRTKGEKNGDENEEIDKKAASPRAAKKAAINGKGAGKPKGKKAEPETRKAVKGLSAPRALRKRDAGEVSDLEDSGDEKGMEVDSD